MAENPPTAGEGFLEANAIETIIETIYVPGGSVNAYKEANGWIDYEDKIKPLGYTVTLDLNDGSYASGSPGTGWNYDSTAKTYSQLITTETVPDITKPTKVGHQFDKWKSGDAEWVFGSSGTKLTADTTLKATWTPNAYTVKYDKNTTDTVTGMPANDTVITYTDAVDGKLAAALTRTGYQFLGWSQTNTAAAADYAGEAVAHTKNTQYVFSGNTNYKYDLSANSGGGVTLYAIWAPNTHSIKYDDNALYDAMHLQNAEGIESKNPYNTHDGFLTPQTIIMNINPYANRERIIMGIGDTLVTCGEDSSKTGDSYTAVVDTAITMYESCNDVYVVDGSVSAEASKDDTDNTVTVYVGAKDAGYYAESRSPIIVSATSVAPELATATTTKFLQTITLGLGGKKIAKNTSLTPGKDYSISLIGQAISDIVDNDTNFIATFIKVLLKTLSFIFNGLR